MKNLITWAGVAMLFTIPLVAQPSNTPSPQNPPDSSAMEQRIKDLEERIIALEGQVRMLKATPAAAPAQPAAVSGPTAAQAQVAVPPPAPTPAEAPPVAPGALPVYGGASASAKALNPDISVIGDFIGKAGGNSVQPTPSLEMHESEVGFQAIIDPYARGDFFISFGESGVNLEEGYITFTALPAGIVARVGKMRSVFGKVNMMHNHVLPWVDRPLVTNNLVGGEDGIDDAGVSISRIIPAPKGLFLEATGQVFRGDSGADDAVFHASRDSDVSAVAHLRSYADINESTNIDIGLSYARGHNELGTDFLTQLYGIDATLRWKPLRRSIYHSFVGRGEFIWSQRQQVPTEQRAFGFYTSADYQLGRRWFLGGRYDLSDRSRFANLTDKGGSLVLTYWPSEFSQIRGQYRHTSYADNISANELFMQVIFSLGAHGAHPF